jgi:spore germination cell wall hydrolase CwlJ-like protein
MYFTDIHMPLMEGDEMKLINKIFTAAAVTLTSLMLLSSTALAADYKVVPNDSLYSISRLFGTSTDKLMADNKLSGSTIYPGQTINVPARVYTVKSGDTLYLIAQKNGITLDDLRKANNKWDNRIYPGQQLLLPGAKTSGQTATQKTVIPYTNAEVDLLARLITAEAKGESYEAMVAVGGVVVNRVQSSAWPNTITEVINHVSGGYYQFTPVKTGAIKSPATSEATQAAWAALYGSDPSKEALFFFDQSSTNQWLWSKPITARIGHMVFAK